MTTMESLTETLTGPAFGFTELEAEKILSVYLGVGALKLDPVTGAAIIPHGALWEREPMERALAMEEN